MKTDSGSVIFELSVAFLGGILFFDSFSRLQGFIIWDFFVLFDFLSKFVLFLFLLTLFVGLFSVSSQ